MSKLSTQNAFTLIELLVVIAIIGVLAAIAMPVYNQHRTTAFNSLARADLKNMLTAQEAGFVDNDIYSACVDAGCNNPTLPGFTLSPGVSGNCVLVAAGESYECALSHVNGDTIYGYEHTGSIFTETPS